jgi:hypothetical protein
MHIPKRCAALQGERALAAVAAVEELKAQASRDRTPPPAQAQLKQHALLKSAAANGHTRQAKVVLPKGKRGAAARLLAVAPQVMPLVSPEAVQPGCSTR